MDKGSDAHSGVGSAGPANSAMGNSDMQEGMPNDNSYAEL